VDPGPSLLLASVANGPGSTPRLPAMEAFFVVVLAAAVLGVGVLALLALLRAKRKMDPPDTQER
jgi:hypothetical protein